MPDRIDRIKLSNCRGATTATDIPVEADKPLVLIFGENGSGKSTIVDAIDMVCNERCGSLDRRSSASPRYHLAAVGCKAADVAVELSIKGQTWRAGLIAGKVVASGPDPRPIAHILRRSQLLRLVEAAPSERYTELARLIDVGPIEACEKTLGDAMREAHTSLEAEIRVKQEAETALINLWQAEGAQENSAQEWAEDKCSADTSALAATVSQLGGSLTCIERAVTAQVEAIAAHEDKRRKATDLASVQKEVSEADGLTAQDSVGLVDILERVTNYLSPPNEFGSCPVCERPVVIGDLRAKLNSRLGAMAKFKALNRRLKTAVQDLETAAALAETLRKRFVSEARGIALYVFAPENAVYLPPGLTTENYPILLSSGCADEKPALGEARKLVRGLQSRQAEFARLRETAQRDLNQFNAIKQYYARVRDGDVNIQKTNEIYERLLRAHEIVRRERLAHTQTILDSVAAECARLYSRIHPGESLGLDRLRLDEQRKGSLHQEANFEGLQDVPPQAYFSESHLDTLGFCFWLAIAKQAGGRKAIVVLDDVFTSVDSVHIRRIIDLLMEECENFRQVIITTHYRTWRDSHRYQQVAASKSHLIELSRWKRARGIRHHRSKLAIEDLCERQKALPFDRQGVASAAGVLLEQALDHLTLLYRCSLRRSQDGDHALGELLDGIRKLAKQLTVTRKQRNADGTLVLPDAEETIVAKPFIESLASMSFIRNEVGCHFNAAGAEISDNDVEGFGDQTVALAKLLVCPSCGEVARRKKGTHHTCSCGELRMEPLEMV